MQFGKSSSKTFLQAYAFCIKRSTFHLQVLLDSYLQSFLDFAMIPFFKSFFVINQILILIVKLNTFVISQIAMLKNKTTLSSVKITRKNIRPASASNIANRMYRSSSQINHIITNLQKNVKDLKQYYVHKDENNRLSRNNFRKGSVIRLKKSLSRNPSQRNLNDHNSKEEKSLTDIFELRNEYLKANGRMSNCVVELYQFYRKTLEKREKSTKILSSMELSNGLSMSCGKESFFKHSQLYSVKQQNKKEEKQSPKIDQQLQQLSLVQSKPLSLVQKNPVNLIETAPLPAIATKKSQRTSLLVSDLLSKRCFNLTNVANLLNSKKYRVTNDKEESLLQANKLKEYQSNKNDKENNKNMQNSSQKSENEIKQSRLYDHFLNQNAVSPCFHNCQEISFKKAKNSAQLNEKANNIHNSLSKDEPIKHQEQSSKKKLRSPSKQQNSSKKKLRSPLRQHQSLKKKLMSPDHSNFKIDNLQSLTESPIVGKGNQFIKSKYYVQPLPKKSNQVQNMNSMSLQSDSKIIDYDCAPFDI